MYANSLTYRGHIEPSIVNDLACLNVHSRPPVSLFYQFVIQSVALCIVEFLESSFISMGNHIISSTIWDKSAQVNF